MTSSWAGRAQRRAGTSTRYPRTGGMRDDGMMREKGKGRRDPWQAGRGSRRSAQHREHSRPQLDHRTAQHSRAQHRTSAVLITYLWLQHRSRVCGDGGVGWGIQHRSSTSWRCLHTACAARDGHWSGPGDGRYEHGRSWPYYSMRAGHATRGGLTVWFQP